MDAAFDFADDQDAEVGVVFVEGVDSPSLRGLEGEAVSAPTGSSLREIAKLDPSYPRHTPAHELSPKTSTPQPAGYHWLLRNFRLSK